MLLSSSLHFSMLILHSGSCRQSQSQLYHAKSKVYLFPTVHSLTHVDCITVVRWKLLRHCTLCLRSVSTDLRIKGNVCRLKQCLTESGLSIGHYICGKSALISEAWHEKQEIIKKKKNLLEIVSNCPVGCLSEGRHVFLACFFFLDQYL